MDPFSISSNTRISVAQPQQQAVASPTQRITIAAPQQQPRLSVVNSPYAPTPTQGNPGGISIAPPDFGSFNFPQLDYEKINSFIADGSQTNPVTGQKYVVGQPVLEVPEWFASTPELQELLPMIERPVDYDDQGNPSHILLTQNFQTGIVKLKEAAAARSEIAAENREQFGFDDVANDAYLKSSIDLQNKGVVTTPDGQELGFSEFKDAWEDKSDYDKAGLLKDWTNAITNKDADPTERGRSLALVQKLNADKLTKGRIPSQARSFLTNAKTEATSFLYNVGDLVTPDSIAKVSKFDESDLYKKTEEINARMSHLQGYNNAIIAGQIVPVVGDIIASAVLSYFTGGAATPKLAAALGKAGLTLERVAGTANIVEDGILIGSLARTTAATAKLANSSANFLKASRLAQFTTGELLAGNHLLAATLTKPGESFAKAEATNAMFSIGTTAALLGLGKTWKTVSNLAAKVTLEGADVDTNLRLGQAIYDDAEELTRIVASTKKLSYGTVEGPLGGSTGSILDVADSMKAIRSLTNNATIQRFILPDAADNAKIFLNDKNPKILEEVFTKYHGEQGVKLAQEFRKYMSGLRDLANKTGQKIDFLESYIPRTGARESAGGTGKAGFGTKTAASETRKIETGREVLESEGRLADVNITNLVANYARDLSAKSANSIAVMNLIHTGDIIRQASKGSASFEAAMANGGIARLVRTLDDGRQITAGFAATDRWLAEHGFQRVVTPALDAAFKNVQKQSKNFKSGFYATDQTIKQLDNFASKTVSTTDTNLITAVSTLSRRVQDAVLSGGFPYTPFNIFAVSQLSGAMMADPLHFYKYIAAMGRTSNPVAFNKYITSELPALNEFAKHGTTFFPDYTLGTATKKAIPIESKANEVGSVDDAVKAIASQEKQVKQLTDASEATARKLEVATEKLAKAEVRTASGAPPPELKPFVDEVEKLKSATNLTETSGVKANYGDPIKAKPDLLPSGIDKKDIKGITVFGSSIDKTGKYGDIDIGVMVPKNHPIIKEYGEFVPNYSQIGKLSYSVFSDTPSGKSVFQDFASKTRQGGIRTPYPVKDITSVLPPTLTATDVGKTATIKRTQTTVDRLTKESEELTSQLTKANKDLEQLVVKKSEIDELWSQENVGWAVAEAIDAKGLKTSLQKGGKILGEQYDKAVSNATFDRFIPTLQFETAKRIVDIGLRKGLSEEQAYAKAREAMGKFWGMSSPNQIGKTGKRIGMTLENRQVYSDMAAIFFLAPKYRAAMIGRFFQTIKAMKNPLAIENRLNFNWAMTGLAMFGAWQAAQKSITGRYTWENPTGAFDELQIPIGDGQIIRIPLWGTQLSIIRNGGRALDALAKGEGERFGQELMGTTSVLAQPIIRSSFNTKYTGKPVSEAPVTSVQGLADRFGFLLSNYTGHPYIQGAQSILNGEILKGVLGALESPLRLGNPDRTSEGAFYSTVIPDIEEIVQTYGKQVRSAYGDTEKQQEIQAKMLAAVADRVRVWGKKFDQDPTKLNQEMASAIMRTVIPSSDYTLGGTDTRQGQEQLDVQQALKRNVREAAKTQGLDLYTLDNYFDDAKAELLGAPADIAFEFKKVVAGNKKDGTPSLYDLKQDWQNNISALYERAKGLSGTDASNAYNQIYALQEQYMREVFVPRIQPLLDKYGPTVLGRSKVFQELEQYVIVPGDFTPFHSTKKQPYLTANQFAYLTDLYGVGKLNKQNIATDEEVLTKVRQANADISSGRFQSADYTLKEVQRKATAGESYINQETMDQIRYLINVINKNKNIRR